MNFWFYIFYNFSKYGKLLTQFIRFVDFLINVVGGGKIECVSYTSVFLTCMKFSCAKKKPILSVIVASKRWLQTPLYDQYFLYFECFPLILNRRISYILTIGTVVFDEIFFPFIVTRITFLIHGLHKLSDVFYLCKIHFYYWGRVELKSNVYHSFMYMIKSQKTFIVKREISFCKSNSWWHTSPSLTLQAPQTIL